MQKDMPIELKELKGLTQKDVEQLLEIWEASVRATHNFLSSAEILRIKGYVPTALKDAERLVVAYDAHETPIGFMGVTEGRLEMLFLSPEHRGKGLGKSMLLYGIDRLGVRELTVNEQNQQAVGFYKHLGFQVYRRTDCDEEGGPYPLLYMKLEQGS